MKMSMGTETYETEGDEQDERGVKYDERKLKE